MTERPLKSHGWVTCGAGLLVFGLSLYAQEQPVTLPATVVTAQKEAEDWLELPLSVSAVAVSKSVEPIVIREAAKVAPGVYINQFTPPALSNPFFRGIGGSPANPGVTTYIDGVPQLNSYSSNIELLDVERVEFIRGPQGALFGRNTPGGLVNIVSARPSGVWAARSSATFGDFDYWDVRGGISGPVKSDAIGMSISGGALARDGYTKNLYDGRDLDSRDALFGKAQMLFTPSEQFEARLLLSGERNRDGDYALGDLERLQRDPWRVRRDFTDGYNDRDLLAPTLILNWYGTAIEAESISGFVYWKSDALTDLDYGVATPGNYFLDATRSNNAEQNQFTQEFRLSSPKDTPIAVSDAVDLEWQGGIFAFYSDYDQRTANRFAAPLSPLSGSSDAALDDYGAGLYGQARFSFAERFELSAGGRLDYEQKDARLSTSASARQDLDEDFFEPTPQVGLAWKPAECHRFYGTVAAGYKAGGFNPAPSGVPGPANTESYDPEHSWNYEIGYKARLFDSKIETGLALFYIHWDDLQLNQQYPGLASQYYIGNAGAAASRGIELQMTARPLDWLDLFGSIAVMDAEFLSGTTSFNANEGVNERVGGRSLPFAPEFTVNGGAEARWAFRRDLQLFVRGQVTGFGEFHYDASNDESQDAYSLVDFRAGLRGKNWSLEGWVANAFDQEYVPIAIPYGPLGAPSGYVGENGAPATFGARLALFF